MIRETGDGRRKTCEVQPGVCFIDFSIGISELADEMRLITAFGPGFTQIQQITICHDAQSRIRDPAVIRASNPPDCESGWTQTLAIVIY